MPDTADKQKTDPVQEVLLLRQKLKVVRDRVNQDLDAIDARLVRILPKSALKPPKIITDWKKEVASW